MSLFDWMLAARPAQGADSLRDEHRRKALEAFATGAAGALVALATGRALASEPEKKEAPAEAKDDKKSAKGHAEHQHKWGMAIDMDRCSGCGACVVACQVENNVPAPGPDQSEQARAIYWMDLLTTSKGEYPSLKVEVMPVPCMQCDEPPCTKVCPVGATYLNDEGIVAQIWDRCIGCRYCMSACPYSRRYFNWDKPEWDGFEQQALNPAVATRPEGVVEKCTFCHHRVRSCKEQARADERALTDNDFRHLTACATACPARAITFGDLNDPKSDVSRLHNSPRAIRLLEELGTKPKVVYLRETKSRE